ncbi:putative NUDIX hydrolase [Variibacter gotjawalensis]|uniref:Putative NUDIX hydrolase n=1 Tax=Variibacter gotjawalensis TaxID=1333996 RepID=A0A0S3PQX6_9BRAD|nr:CoA pyrophosphatase [Variibacter gotjawalensis]NIK48667.1 8-oxo-dGTP pyrophosphatase MutT (NUDIX family) [Variibacter gotjawalensis]RZS50528.1 ADP-ribose pyrophosphatase YjhB (NUDIX family) [Variibacter gotjawalensis]BAT58363.1 putative NUDIX hydrolase [Variibacter gotjawalensis]
MSYPLNEFFRREVAERCAAFPRQVPVGDVAGLKQAAVALVLVEAKDDPGEAAFLLTRRPQTLRAHSGQYALPGGRCDPGETVTQTALRETEEELGLALPPENVLGMLDDFVTRSGYMIAPVVVWAGAGLTLTPNPDEIAHVFRIRIADIMRPNSFGFQESEATGRQEIHALINDDQVYAPTAAMIFQFREVLAGRATRVADLEQPLFAWR